MRAIALAPLLLIACGTSGPSPEHVVDQGPPDSRATFDSLHPDVAAPTATPKTLATAAPVVLAVDATSVYWIDRTTSPETLESLPLAGGTMSTLLGGIARGTDLAADGTSVYLGDLGVGKNHALVESVPAGGGAPIVLAKNLDAVGAVAVDAAAVYFASCGSCMTGIADGSVKKVAIGGAGSVAFLLAGVNPVDLAVLGGFAYVVDAGPGPGMGDVVKVPVGGGLATVIDAEVLAPTQIAVDASFAYVLDQGTSLPSDGRLLAIPLGGGAHRVLAGGLRSPSGVAAAGGSVYFSDAGMGLVARVGASGAVAAVADGEYDPSDVQVDGTSAYWLTAGGRIEKTPR